MTMRNIFGYVLLAVFVCGWPLVVGCGDKPAVVDVPLAETDSDQNAESSNGGSSPNTDVASILALTMFSWNVESEGSDPKIIGEQLTEMNDYDVYALTEVLPGSFELYRKSVGEKYRYAFSKSGNNDRMMIVYDNERFELLREFNLDEINVQGRYRAPLVAHLKERLAGTEFLVMVNHLARGKAEIRQEQAAKLVEWARDQTLPVVALGDYNLDYVFEDENGNDAFKIMMRDNVWKWVKPIEWIDTNWYDDPREPDGLDDYPGSMLDFAFVAGPAKEWTVSCKIIVRDGDFPDDETTSDHRPYEVFISQ
jgi:endonuclease/exonuclease/phosphatase family metal-dependent hydrolase